MKRSQHLNPIAIFGALGLALATASGQSISHVATTQLNNNGDTFDISIKDTFAGYRKSAALGSTIGAYGDGTLLDWRIETVVGTENPFQGNTVSKGPGTYFDTPTCPMSIGGTQNWLKVWTTNTLGTDPSPNITTGTVIGAGSTAVPLIGNIAISGLTGGQFYVVTGAYAQAVNIYLTMTGPGQTPLTTSAYIPSPGNNNRLHSVEFAFSNPGGNYYNIQYKVDNGGNTGRLRYGGVLLDGTAYVDAAEPTWVATWPNAGPVSSTLFTVNGNINENGSAYYVVLPDGATAPTSAQVKAGTDAADAPAPLSGSFALGALVQGSKMITGVTASTAYDVYMVAEDIRGPNLQAAPVLVDVTTNPPDTTPPGWTATYPQVSRTPAGLTGIANIDEPGNAYFVVLANGATAPTSAQVKAGTDAADSPAPFGGSMSLLNPGTSGGAAVNGLTIDSTYDVYFVAEDLEGNLQASPQMVTSAPEAPVSQYATGGFAWGTAAVWSGVTGGPYTSPWGPGNNAVFEGTAGVVPVASGTVVNDMTFSGGNFILQGGPLSLIGTTQPMITVTAGIPKLEVSLSGTQGFIKTGSGTLQMTGSNSLTGGIVISQGFLGDNGGAPGTATLNNNEITANGGTVGLTVAGGATTNGGITLASGTLRISNNNSSFTVNGAVTGPGGIELNKTGLGSNTLNLNSTSNNFTGGVNYTNDLIVSLNVNSLADATSLGSGDITFGSGNGTAAHNFAYGSGATAALTLDNRQFKLAGTGATQTPTIKNNSSYAFTINTDLLSTATGTRTLTLGGTGTGLSTFGGLIANGTIATLNLTKADSGTWVLGGANSYNGATTVSAGTLLINGDQSLATGAVAVNGGTLGGTGTIGGNVTVAAAASLAPGDPTGTLNIAGNLTIASLVAGKLKFDLATIAASDKIALASGKVLTIGSGALGLSDFSFTDLGGLQNGTYPLIQTDQPISGTLAADTNGTLGSATIDLQISGDGSDLVLVVSGLSGGSAYETWAGAGVLFGDDKNGDGVPNGLAFLLGAADPDANATGLLPKSSANGGGLVMEFDCLATADRGPAVLTLEYDGALSAPWLSVPVPGAVGDPNPIVETTATGSVSFVATANGSLIHIVATISDATESAAGKLFGRLQGNE